MVKKNNLDSGPFMLNMLCRVEAIEHGHTDVDNDDVGFQGRCCAHQLPPVTYRSDHLEFGFEQLLAEFSYEIVIISNKNSRTVHILISAFEFEGS